MTGVKRNIAAKIQFLLQHFPAVAIIGVRQCGKTTLSQQIVPDWTYFDLENPDHFERISQDPVFFFEQHPQHLIIDEAQEYPEVFKVLRGVIDSDRQHKGRFLLTGSSSPDLLTHISESLAGRIAIVELGTLKANEAYGKPLSPFYQIFNNKINKASFNFKDELPLSSAQMQQLWLKGGYPEPVLQNDNNFYEQWMDYYRDTYINRDVAKRFPKLNKIKYQRFIQILSKLSCTILNKSDIGRAIEVSETTVREYISIAEGSLIWRQLNSFEKNVVKSIIKMPKGQLRDSGLLHHFLKIKSLEDLYNDPISGRSFESFVIEELLKGLEATLVSNWQAHYYRTRNGAEIDLILDGPFGILPIEIKQGANPRLKQLTALRHFIQEHKLHCGMVINQSNKIEWLTSEIIQIPVGWL